MNQEKVTLALEVETSGVKQGVEALDRLENSGKKADRTFTSMSDAATKINHQIDAMAQKATVASVAVGRLDSNLKGGIASMARDAEKASAGISSIANAARGASGGSLFSGLGAAAASAAGGLTAIASGFAAIELARVSAVLSIKDTADELSKLSQRTGFAVESLSEFRYIGELSDVGLNDLTLSLRNLANHMQEAAKGSGIAFEAFKAMGVSVKDANGNMRSTEDVLGDIADKFKIYNEGALKSALAVDLFGRAGEKLIPLLNQGRDGFRENAEEARKLGVVYSTELAKKAEELNDNMTRLKFAFEGTKIYLASEMMPTIAGLAEQLVAGTKAAGGFFAALNAVGTLNPFKSNSENLKSVQADIAKMEQDLKEYGYIDDMKFARKKSQLAYLKDMQIKEAVALGDGAYSNEGRGLTKLVGKTDAPIPENAKKKPKGSSGRSIAEQASEEAKAYEQAMKSFSDIARDADASTLDLSASQKKLYDLMVSPGWVKMPDTWKQTAVAQFEAARAAELNVQWLASIEVQEQKNSKSRQSMLENIRLAEESATVFGLSAEQLTAVAESRLADAIAMAKQNGATEDLLEPMREELSLLQQLGKAQEKNSLQSLLANTEAAKKNQQDAKKALLDRALASGDITPEMHKQAVASLSGAADELGEFAKQAAHNMQDAMAEFFFDPFKAGTDGMVKQMGTAFQRMVANTAALQANKFLFGTMDKDGQLGGLVGKGVSWLADTFKFHEGGVVGQGTSMPALAPVSLWENAPRFHSGGIVGDEVPIIAKKGERVLTKEQQQAMGGMTIHQTIYAGNGTDKAEVRRAAASGARTALGALSEARRYG